MWRHFSLNLMKAIPGCASNFFFIDHDAFYHCKFEFYCQTSNMFKYMNVSGKSKSSSALDGILELSQNRHLMTRSVQQQWLHLYDRLSSLLSACKQVKNVILLYIIRGNGSGSIISALIITTFDLG